MIAKKCLSAIVIIAIIAAILPITCFSSVNSLEITSDMVMPLLKKLPLIQPQADGVMNLNIEAAGIQC